MGIEVLSVGAVLAVLGFLFGALQWLIKHFDPYISRLLDSIDDIRETGQRMADIGERLVKIVEAQQDWQENLDAILTERHKRIMERFDTQDNTMTRILFVLRECPAGKGKNDYE